MPSDPSSEREKFVRVYADMPDAKLQDLAALAFTLTDSAREALKDEIARRVLDATIVDTVPDLVRDPKLVTIRRFRDLPDALLAKSVLESAEIQCFLADDIIVRMDWFWSYAVGEVKVRVLDTDAAASEEILKLNESPPEFIEFGGIEPYPQARCPNCKSFDIWHDELRRAAYVTLLLFWFFKVVPAIPLRRRGWTCHACGHRSS